MRYLHTSYPNSTIWIAGDANLPDINWKTNTVAGHNYPVTINKLFLDTVLDFSLEQIVQFPTRNENILDVFITNRQSLIQRCNPVPGVSNHDGVFVQAEAWATRAKPPRRKILLWKNADTRSAQQPRTLPMTTSRYTPETDINTLWEPFKESICSVIACHVPSKFSTTRFNQPWITRKAKRLSRQKKRAFKKANETGNDQDLSRLRFLK
jgi:hypothetical protein